MYARIITSQFKPASIDDAIHIWQDSMISSLKQSQGFKGAYVTGDRHTGKGVTITLWETEVDANAVDSSGQYQQSIALFANHLAGPPSREQFEVLLEV
jgi:heme-degrading monooxygenase HmoA